TAPSNLMAQDAWQRARISHRGERKATSFRDDSHFLCVSAKNTWAIAAFLVLHQRENKACLAPNRKEPCYRCSSPDCSSSRSAASSSCYSSDDICARQSAQFDTLRRIRSIEAPLPLLKRKLTPVRPRQRQARLAWPRPAEAICGSDQAMRSPPPLPRSP